MGVFPIQCPNIPVVMLNIGKLGNADWEGAVNLTATEQTEPFWCLGENAISTAHFTSSTTSLMMDRWLPVK